MTFEYSQEIINDLEKLLETDKRYDVIIYAGENENAKEIHALSNILCIRSQYFHTVLSDEFTEKKDGKFIVKMPNISSQIFKIILRFIYCGKVDLSKLQGPDILKLLIVAGELKIQTLILCIQEYLIKNQHEFLQQNPTEILEMVYQHETFTDLWNFCLEKICTEPEILFNSEKFTSLKAPLLELLLKRDDLLLDEIDIWNNLIKWSFAQHTSVQQDIKKWNKEDITIMERTLHRFIPLVRFYHISSEDFLLKVYPFKVLLPEDLIDNILTIHMAPNKKLNIDMQPPRQSGCIYDSTLIKAEHFAIFSSWIEKKNNFHYNVKNIPYDFNLLYRASRDGDTAAAFHNKCDFKEATIVVVKIANSEQLVGGYNPLSWNSSNSTRDSFIFSFTSRNNLQGAKVGYSYGKDSVQCIPSHGPVFGNDGNLYFNNYKWYGGGSSERCYPKINMPANFNADDWEVFHVVKK